MIKFIDVSHWQGTIDFDKLKAKSDVKGVIIKATGTTTGQYVIDPMFKRNKAEARRTGFAIGYYHITGGYDPIKEADFFLDSIGDIAIGERLALDFEIHISDPVGFSNKFVARIIEKAFRPMFYGYSSLIGGYNWGDIYNCSLWIADPSAKPRIGKWATWEIWQYSQALKGTVPGISEKVDLNWFNGTLEDFRKLGKQDNQIISTSMKNYHLFAHMDRNLVRKGDKVIQYVTPIGTIGDGNGQYFAHLHFSISNGLTPAQLKAYISGWTKVRVERYYKDPREIDFAKMFGTKMDVGNFGYDWLQWVGYGYHPGVDVNGLKGGNTDFGMPFKASCNGTVIYEIRTWMKNGGWGNLIVVEEE